MTIGHSVTSQTNSFHSLTACVDDEEDHVCPLVQKEQQVSRRLIRIIRKSVCTIFYWFYL